MHDVLLMEASTSLLPWGSTFLREFMYTVTGMTGRRRGQVIYKHLRLTHFSMILMFLFVMRKLVTVLVRHKQSPNRAKYQIV